MLHKVTAKWRLEAPLLHAQLLRCDSQRLLRCLRRSRFHVHCVCHTIKKVRQANSRLSAITPVWGLTPTLVAQRAVKPEQAAGGFCCLRAVHPVARRSPTSCFVIDGVVPGRKRCGASREGWEVMNFQTSTQRSRWLFTEAQLVGSQRWLHCRPL